MMIVLSQEELDCLLFNHSIMTLDNFDRMKVNMEKLDEEDYRVLCSISEWHVNEIFRFK